MNQYNSLQYAMYSVYYMKACISWEIVCILFEF